MKHLVLVPTGLFALPCFAGPAADYAAQAAGSWTSIEQSADPAYDWVESEVVRIWPDREDGIWLYQENAIMGASATGSAAGDPKSRPYFQVIIQLRDLGGGQVHSTTWRIADREAVLGGWRAGAKAFGFSVLGEVACMGKLQRVGQKFWQGQAECPNTYKDSVKVDSRTVRAPGVHVNWDRGYDAAGNHVWGPADGGYIFKRRDTQ